MIQKIAVTNFLRYSTLLNDLQNPIKSTPAVLENDKVSNYQKYTIQFQNLQNPLISNHCETIPCLSQNHEHSNHLLQASSTKTSPNTF